MNILDVKPIPLKIHAREKGLTIAWHWQWPITWRWIVKWDKGRYKWEKKKFINTANGHGLKHYGLGRFGIIRVTYQPNMARTLETQPIALR